MGAAVSEPTSIHRVMQEQATLLLPCPSAISAPSVCVCKSVCRLWAGCRSRVVYLKGCGIKVLWSPSSPPPCRPSSVRPISLVTLLQPFPPLHPSVPPYADSSGLFFTLHLSLCPLIHPPFGALSVIEILGRVCHCTQIPLCMFVCVVQFKSNIQ